MSNKKPTFIFGGLIFYGTYFIVHESALSYQIDPDGNPKEPEGKFTILKQLTYVVFGQDVVIL
jgi:hypothetical protein